MDHACDVVQPSEARDEAVGEVQPLGHAAEDGFVHGAQAGLELFPGLVRVFADVVFETIGNGVEDKS